MLSSAVIRAEFFFVTSDDLPFFIAARTFSMFSLRDQSSQHHFQCCSVFPRVQPETLQKVERTDCQNFVAFILTRQNRHFANLALSASSLAFSRASVFALKAPAMDSHCTSLLVIYKTDVTAQVPSIRTCFSRQIPLIFAAEVFSRCRLATARITILAKLCGDTMITMHSFWTKLSASKVGMCKFFPVCQRKDDHFSAENKDARCALCAIARVTRG